MRWSGLPHRLDLISPTSLSNVVKGEYRLLSYDLPMNKNHEMGDFAWGIGRCGGNHCIAECRTRISERKGRG